ECVLHLGADAADARVEQVQDPPLVHAPIPLRVLRCARASDARGEQRPAHGFTSSKRLNARCQRSARASQIHAKPSAVTAPGPSACSAMTRPPGGSGSTYLLAGMSGPPEPTTTTVRPTTAAQRQSPAAANSMTFGSAFCPSMSTSRDGCVRPV